ncbi:hypothetical protein HG531_012650 [Fusarium graminearum]|nr:hypothetical protein HG531_012650 [Fusarium graminearum]
MRNSMFTDAFQISQDNITANLKVVILETVLPQLGDITDVDGNRILQRLELGFDLSFRTSTNDFGLGMSTLDLQELFGSDRSIPSTPLVTEGQRP